MMSVSGNAFYSINGLIASAAPPVVASQTSLTVDPLKKAVNVPVRPTFTRVNQGSTTGVLRPEAASPSIGNTPGSPIAPVPTSSQQGSTSPSVPVNKPTPTPAAPTPTEPAAPVTLTQNEYGYGLVAKGGDGADKLAQFIEFATAYTSGNGGDDTLIQYGKYAHLDARGGTGNDVTYQSLFYSSSVAHGNEGDDLFVIGGYHGNAWVDGGEGNNTAILRGPWFTWQESQQGVWQNWLTNTRVVMNNVQTILFGDYPEPDVPKPPSFR
jgi:hypothetical protein